MYFQMGMNQPGMMPQQNMAMMGNPGMVSNQGMMGNPGMMGNQGMMGNPGMMGAQQQQVNIFLNGF